MGGGANASSGPPSLEEEQKKVYLLEDSAKANNEELQRLRQEKVTLECELRDERVEKNRLHAEKMRLTADLQAVPDHAVLTAQITEYEKELQHVRNKEEELRREVCRLECERDSAVLSSHNTHILQEKEDKIHKMEVALKVSKEGNATKMDVYCTHKVGAFFQYCFIVLH